MSMLILSLEIRFEQDVVYARQRSRHIAALLGFDTMEQTRLATAVSEITRNALTYAGGGTVELLVEGEEASQRLVVRVTDRGPGMADLPLIPAGRHRSAAGAGMGIIGARRLVDQFRIESSPGRGTMVELGKSLPKRAPVVTWQAAAQIGRELARREPATPWAEIEQQNQELLRALEELRARQEQLTRLNRELEDINRGVLALYAELDEKADHLRRADELKSRFLSNMSHEFRTPLNSILALSRLLLDRTDGGLTAEQEKQVAFIRKAARDLSELVNDLLDLAKVEAGRIVVRPAEFTVGDLFRALKGMLRPLLVTDAVSLVFEEPAGIPPLHTDEGKVSQILRNFLSNALKFTERGEVRVAAAMDPRGDAVVFAVTDTGIGIAPDDQERIFEEFAQVEGPHQRRVKGTGLGLPLARKLAELLGGQISVASRLGAGSTFTARIPCVYAEAAPASLVPGARQPDPLRVAVLVVGDDPEVWLLYDRYLKGTGFQVVPAATAAEARGLLARIRPAAVVLDVRAPEEGTWRFLTQVKADGATSALPILVAGAADHRRKATALGADDACVRPVERRWLLSALRRLGGRPVETVLVIDDDEVSRYLLKGLLADTRYAVVEATRGADGLRQAREVRPAVIVLDLVMPETSGFEVLERLKADPATRDIPVIVSTAKVLAEEERRRLAAHAVAILPKETVSREAARQAIRQALMRARSLAGTPEEAA